MPPQDVSMLTVTEKKKMHNIFMKKLEIISGQRYWANLKIVMEKKKQFSYIFFQFNINFFTG